MTTTPKTAFKKGEKTLNQGNRGPNKMTVQLKDMILTALSNVGGAEYLERRANDPKTAGAFLGLIGKVLPMTVIGAGEDGAHLFVSIERKIVRPEGGSK